MFPEYIRAEMAVSLILLVTGSIISTKTAPKFYKLLTLNRHDVNCSIQWKSNLVLFAGLVPIGFICINWPGNYLLILTSAVVFLSQACITYLYGKWNIGV